MYQNVDAAAAKPGAGGVEQVLSGPLTVCIAVPATGVWRAHDMMHVHMTRH